MKTLKQKRNSCSLFNINLLFVSVWFVLGVSVLVAQTGSYVAGQSYFGRNEYIEYIAGNLPIILSAPHGGHLEPVELPDRSYGTLTYDTNTQELLRDMQAALFARYGKYPHVVICRLHRKKIDVNRDSVEGAQGNQYTLQAWQEFHAFLDSASAAVTRQSGKGFYIDLHAHGHTIQRLELGYLLSSAQLNLTDQQLNIGYAQQSSIRALAVRSPYPFSTLMRGAVSFGAFMERRGYACVPSEMNPTPNADPYFTGGYDTERHGSVYDGSIDAVQIESHYAGVRDTDPNRKAFASAISEALWYFMKIHYDGFIPSAPSLVLNEVLFDVPPDSAGTPELEGDINGDGVRSPRGDEFIEIVNKSSASVDIGGVRILEKSLVPVFTFPPSTVLQPKQYAVVFGGIGPNGFGANLPQSGKYFAARVGQADSGFFVSSSKTNFLGAGDNVILFDPVSNDILDEVSWGSSSPKTVKGKKLIAPNTVFGDSIAGAIGQSVTRFPSSSGLWTTHLSVGDGKSKCSPGIGILSGVENDIASLPTSLILEQNYPNPFNPSTTIRYGIPVRSNITLKLYDIMGRELSTIDGGLREAGMYHVVLTMETTPSGIYFYRLTAGSPAITKKLCVVR